MSFKLNWVRLLLTAIMAPGVVFAEQPASPMPPPTAPNPLFFANKGTTAEQKLTKTDIPQNLPRQLKKEIEATFDNSAMERGAAAEKLGRRGEAAVAAVPFLIRLLSDDGDCGVRWIDAKDGRTLQLSEDVRDRGYGSYRRRETGRRAVPLRASPFLRRGPRQRCVCARAEP